MHMEKQLVCDAPPMVAPRSALRISRSASGPPRSYFGNRFVYAVISQRAHGLSIGVNLNPDKFCNFDCAYCEVDRRSVPKDARIDLDGLATELEEMLGRAFYRRMRALPGYESVPEDLLKLKEVALSGDGEPTLCPMFAEVVETVLHVRAKCVFPFFKVVLITNSTGLHLTHVQRGLKLLTNKDEIWAKLDAGTEACLEQVNRPKSSPLNCPSVTLEHVIDNIFALARQRPVVIQSLFPLINGKGPTPDEITAYAERLKDLKQQGAQIALVQVYSAHRPPARPNCGHLPLRDLSQIARRVRELTGLRTEVF
jgi:wyosine [tRNA(Phe)-imidazoG37] synthetase (radical SAM superfamily)